MKKKIAFYWAASCGGCEVAVLDINEKILDVIEKADIVFWPVALDIKYKDLEGMENKGIDFCFFNGAIRTSENEKLAKLLRKKSKYMVAFGACACYGGIPGLANLFSREEIFKRVYEDNPSTFNPKKTLPKKVTKVKEGELDLPEFYNVVKTLDQIVEVDYYIPGCPPPVDVIKKAFDILLSGELPPKGSVLAPQKSVCDECPFEKGEKKITKIRRVHEVNKVEEKCFLEQGIICTGPATRAGCNAACIRAGMPCTGCMGLLPNSRDQGAKMISALASILGVEQEERLSDEEMEKTIDQIVDLVGTFYKYSLPAAIINRRVIERRK